MALATFDALPFGKTIEMSPGCEMSTISVRAIENKHEMMLIFIILLPPVTSIRLDIYRPMLSTYMVRLKTEGS